jgi:hypothetical protein
MKDVETAEIQQDRSSEVPVVSSQPRRAMNNRKRTAIRANAGFLYALLMVKTLV